MIMRQRGARAAAASFPRARFCWLMAVPVLTQLLLAPPA
jgi:hypothetical protein